mgnify:CR=1 FL=1
MGWASLALALVKLANLVMGYLDKKQLLDAGEAKNVVKAMEALHAEVDKARAAIAAIRTDPTYADKLRRLADRDG